MHIYQEVAHPDSLLVVLENAQRRPTSRGVRPTTTQVTEVEVMSVPVSSIVSNFPMWSEGEHLKQDCRELSLEEALQLCPRLLYLHEPRNEH
jgi:hypothetical protein